MHLCSCTCESSRLMLGISFNLFHLIYWSRVLQLNSKLANRSSLRLDSLLWWCPVSSLWGWNDRHTAIPNSIYLSSGDAIYGPNACLASALTTEQSPHFNTSNVKYSALRNLACLWPFSSSFPPISSCTTAAYLLPQDTFAISPSLPTSWSISCHIPSALYKCEPGSAIAKPSLDILGLALYPSFSYLSSVRTPTRKD